MQPKQKGGFRRFVQTPAGKSLLIAFAIAAVFGAFVYVTPLLAIPAFLLVGLAIPIYAGLKRPRYLALSGLVVLLLVAPVSSAAYAQEILTPVAAASSSSSLPAGNGGAVLQDAHVSPFNGDASTNFTWNVTVYPQYLTSTIDFVLPAGVYPYHLGSVPGFQAGTSAGNVTDSVSAFNVTFARGPHSVTFQETGLASGTNWSASLNGAVGTSSSGTIPFSVASGTYPFSLGAVAGYSVNRTSGTVSVGGGGAVVDVSFARIAYPVTFAETGLPSGTAWNVTVNGSTYVSTGSSLTVVLANGSHPYAFGSITGFQASPASGSATVSGTNVSVNTTYSQTTQTVAFTESGLPAGTSWSVTLGSTTNRSVNRTISFVESNGRYSYAVGTVSGYARSPQNSSVTLSGTSQEVNVTFTPPERMVSFTEEGLPAGANWSVLLNGSSESAVNSPVALFLYISTCPGATTNESGTCPGGYSFTSLKNAFLAPVTSVTGVAFHYTIGTDGIWSWQMALESRDSAGHFTLVSLVGDPAYNGIEGPVVGDFAAFFAELLPTLYFDCFLFLGAPFYLVLLLYMIFKNRERRRQEMVRRSAGPIPPASPPATGPSAGPLAPGGPGPRELSAPGPPSGSPAQDELPCPNCSALVYPGESRCWKCGAALPATSEPTASSP